MINPQELQLGNLFQDHLTGRILTVDSISRDRIIFDQHGEALPTGWQAEPIPIREEWLQRYGFERRWMNNAFWEYYINCTPPNYKRDFVLAFTFGCMRDTPKGVCDSDRWYKWMSSGDSHSFNIKYIHQLQNLYFAFTGQELTLKEPI